MARSVRKFSGSRQADGTPTFENVPRLEVDGRAFAGWQEAVEKEVASSFMHLCGAGNDASGVEVQLSCSRRIELLRDAKGEIAGMIARNKEMLEGVVEIKAASVGDQVYKVRVGVKNLTTLDGAADRSGRDTALLRSLVSAHIVLGVEKGEFISLLEPPDSLRESAASCVNVGVWPVLVGAEGERDTMLASPIILYDYPQIAPESPGDLFDGTEIDEILALRIMTMTEDEKNEMRNTDDRARRVLERTENLPIEHLMKLHGTLRELRPLEEEVPTLKEEVP